MAKGKHDEAPSVPPDAAPLPVPADAPFLVRATLGGTYPDPGSVLARWRNPGDVFECKCAADKGRWMQRLTDAEASTVQGVAKPIPQTTGKARKPSPYPQA